MLKTYLKNPKSFSCDFELVINNALELNFPYCIILGCFRFHLAKNLWKQMQDYGLTKKENYNIAVNVSYQRLKVLPFVHFNDIFTVFELQKYKSSIIQANDDFFSFNERRESLVNLQFGIIGIISTWIITATVIKEKILISNALTQFSKTHTNTNALSRLPVPIDDVRVQAQQLKHLNDEIEPKFVNNIIDINQHEPEPQQLEISPVETRPLY
ncbi:hypothetical protein BpHYR1_002466 [Brachionus plicatilis]|uniref:MULE transposase domain-containing protein n=1 Tax=Brachionus plicatilis TaxID=10195 RepID=A0A3M7SBD7_BRAPC|nr:hypothetical protein BpHYR1_002466 [Brachionus plicatilis]